jgi:hypothetical protein
VKQTRDLQNFWYIAALIVATLGVAILPLIPSFEKPNPSDLELLQNNYVRIAASIF